MGLKEAVNLLEKFRRISLEKFFTKHQQQFSQVGKIFEYYFIKAVKELGYEIEVNKKYKCKALIDREYFTIIPDIIVKSYNKEVLIELKAMPKGVYKKPDALAIAFDYIHLKNTYPNKPYIVILAYNKYRNEAKQILEYSSDKLFSLQLNNLSVDIQEKLKQLNEIIQTINSKPPIRLKIAKHQVNLPPSDQPSPKLDYIKGRKLEKEIIKIMRKYKLSPIERKQIKAKLLGTGPYYTIEANIYIENPKTVIECKTRKHPIIDAGESKAAAIDAITLKQTLIPHTYILIHNPTTKPNKILAIYTDKTITTNQINQLIKYLLLKQPTTK